MCTELHFLPCAVLVGWSLRFDLSITWKPCACWLAGCTSSHACSSGHKIGVPVDYIVQRHHHPGDRPDRCPSATQKARVDAGPDRAVLLLLRPDDHADRRARLDDCIPACADYGAISRQQRTVGREDEGPAGEECVAFAGSSDEGSVGSGSGNAISVSPISVNPGTESGPVLPGGAGAESGCESEVEIPDAVASSSGYQRRTPGAGHDLES
jgi:hypothetical protein